MGQIVRLRETEPKQGKKKARKEFVARPRLTAEMDEHQAVMALLYAPAGYGKTVILRQYQEHQEAAGVLTGWLTLNDADRDERHLAERIISHLPGATLDMLLGETGFSSESCTLDVDCTLFLDNAERIVGSPGEKLLVRLFEQKVPGLRLVLASRLLPRFGVVRLQLGGELAVFDARSLCFSHGEMSEFFAEKGLEVSKRTSAALHQLTEGWPVAIQVAALALKDEKLDSERLVKGDHHAWRSLHRYFLDEILSGLAPELRSFVLEIAPLGRVTWEFARDLTGQEGAEQYLQELEENGLLTMEDSGPLQQWYRFHPLLSSFLETVLQKENPQRLVEIHRAATAWNKKEGRLSDAVRHAFAAGETLTAAELLERASLERRRHGRPTPVADWSDRISDEAYDKHPLLRMEAACSFATSFAVEAARIHANSVRKQFSDLEPIVRDDLFAVDALIKVYADQPEGLVEVAERGLRDCAAGDPYTLGTLRLSAAIGLIARGKLDSARRAALEARAENDRAENPFGAAVSHMLLGLVHVVEGNLPAAVDAWKLADKVIQPATSMGLVDKIAIGYLPEALLEWNQPEEARTYLDRCLDGPIEIMLPDMLTSAYLTAARIATLEGDHQRAVEILDSGEAVAVEKSWPRVLYAIEWERVRMALLRKDYDEAKRLRSAITAKNDFIETAGILTHALETEADLIGELRFETLLAPNPAVISRVRAAISQALATNRKWRAAKLMVIEAICRKTLGDNNAALRAMRAALKLGSPGRLVRTFIDEGPLAVSLIREIRDEDALGSGEIANDYLDLLLKAAGGALPQLEEEPVVIEALSERELEVLKLIFDGCSNADAARRLFVSENTVKWHLQHIYSKLGVKNRTAAVAAARVLNLVG